VVCVKALLEVLWEPRLDACVLQLPHLEGVEPEVILTVGAMPVLRLAIFQIRLAVVPKPNLVNVAHVAGGSGDLHLLDGLRCYALGKIVEEGLWVVLEACGIRLYVVSIGVGGLGEIAWTRGRGWVGAAHLEEIQFLGQITLLICLARQDNRETQKTRNRQRHWRENTRETPCLAHDDVESSNNRESRRDTAGVCDVVCGSDRVSRESMRCSRDMAMKVDKERRKTRGRWKDSLSGVGWQPAFVRARPPQLAAVWVPQPPWKPAQGPCAGARQPTPSFRDPAPASTRFRPFQ
jgi:hypothetical protein